MTTTDVLQALIIPAALGGWLTADVIRRASVGVRPRPIKLQFASSGERATALVAAWNDSMRAGVRRSIQWDFGFIPSYALFLAGVASLPSLGPAWIDYIRGWVVVAPLFAGLFDVIENLGMLEMLRSKRVQTLLPLFVTVCAILKFLLIAGTLVFILVALAAAVYERL